MEMGLDPYHLATKELDLETRANSSIFFVSSAFQYLFPSRLAA